MTVNYTYDNGPNARVPVAVLVGTDVAPGEIETPNGTFLLVGDGPDKDGVYHYALPQG